MTIFELKEKRSRLLSEANAKLQGDITPESRAHFDAITKDIDVLDGDISRMELAEKYQSEVRNMPTRPQPGTSNDPVENAEVRKQRVNASFRKWMATGQVESRDLTAAAYGEGANTILVPTSFDRELVSAKKSFGDLYSMVNVIQTENGEPMRVALDDDTSNGLVTVSVGTDVAEQDPALTGKTVNMDVVSTQAVRVDIALLQDAGFDVEAWVRDKFATRYMRGASNYIFSGNTSNVAALAGGDYTAGITTGTTGTIKYADMVALQTSLDPAYQNDAVWGFSQAALGQILSIVDNQGRPIFMNLINGPENGYIGQIFGKPVKLIQQAPGVACTMQRKAVQ